MLPSNRATSPQREHPEHIERPVTHRKKPLILLRVVGLCLCLALFLVELIPLDAQIASAQTQSHTVATVEPTCSGGYYSSDGNPFSLCPGPYPRGGNCVWWAWEQWHLLGYDLPLDWGNAADWIVDAERAGLPVGTVPRIGSIAVFPRADGVWAYGAVGHVAFVTSVSGDGETFNVTYQNYGDPTPMYVGTGYNVSVINQPDFQDGELRFIYFPRDINPRLFARLPGVGSVNLNAIMQANALAAISPGIGDTSNAATTTSSRLALGLSPTSTDEEFNADFAGNGLSDLLLYNRQQGSLDVMSMYPPPLPPNARHYLTFDEMEPGADPSPNVVSLGDSITPVGQWGSTLDVHIGNFDGGNASEILLYDQVTGTIQILSLNPDLTIKKHVVLPGYGPGWELYVGRFNGKSSSVFMYKRYAQPDAGTPSSSSNSSSSGTNPGTSPANNTNNGTTAPGTQSGPTSSSPSAPSAPATPTPGPAPTPTPTPQPTPTPTPTPTPQPTPTPTPTPTPQPTPTPTPTPAPAPSSSSTPTPTPAPAPAATPTPAATSTAPLALTTTANPKSVLRAMSDPSTDITTTDTPPDGNNATNSNAADNPNVQNWAQQGLTANAMMLNFKPDLSVASQQLYVNWHANWEVYVGRFAGAQQDGIFLYDRQAGEGRLFDFDQHLQVAHFQELHNLDSNWLVYSGDFIGSGRAQLLLYDPVGGDAQMLSFKPDLSQDQQQTYTDWGQNLIPYVGHFGTTATSSLMLYDPQQAESTFMEFDPSLNVSHQYTVKSWDQNWQILVGSFIDHNTCRSNCGTGDDILVLNRKTGQLEEYAFSFGRKYQVFDNRLQPFMREGIASDYQVQSNDTSTFSMVTTFNTTIRDEELY